ncbi:MAG: MFS transporter [Coriobacteriales bacterium]|jgi:MFS family permease|nr:MFS transporter [Coriobacteriales bacterium]
MDIQYPKFRYYFALVFFLTYVANGICMIAPSPLVPAISGVLGIDPGLGSMVLILSYTAGGIVGGIVGGAIADRFGLPLTYIACCILSVLGFVLTWVAGASIVLVLAGRIIGGLAGGTPGALGSKMVVQWFPGHQRSVVLGIGSGGLSLGTAIGLAVVAPIFAQTGGDWNTAISVVATPWAILVIMCIFLFRTKPPVDDAAFGAEAAALSNKQFGISIQHQASDLLLCHRLAVVRILDYERLQWSGARRHRRTGSGRLGPRRSNSRTDDEHLLFGPYYWPICQRFYRSCGV